MPGNDSFGETEELLMMAAAVHGLGPEIDLDIANAHLVVGQVLKWAGLMQGEVREAWENPGMEYHPTIVQIYGALIRMIHRVDAGTPPGRAGIALFEGGGNFGTPGRPTAFPHFTSCRLTDYGAQTAARLLEQRPEYRKRV